ncbi:MAG: hypothetical protein ACPGID_10975, partial [Rubricella sp.]
TNLPHAARSARIDNLAEHGIAWPVVTNSGGKGPAIAALAARAEAPVVFIDDSPSQIRSAKAHAPAVTPVHFVGCDFARSVIPAAEGVGEGLRDWDAAADAIRTAVFNPGRDRA